ncbi:hypothetical protein CKM354_000334700 [Cercospora kikuchii]|uniref:Glyoxalase-like domain-containing protein n=1 Tax=Cercospora kikuchii TaxID=84275 RepID=A0A9P3CK52_9PEZI|nr:uncharacterized protein CKM354_000334700 [Cercospora kikuchii]GIZ39988.1 hypothetical protein CKM354_000334700 [Cercospora kikuchii]
MTRLHAQLDHVVLLLPYQDILNPPSWLTDNFVISEGGRHADGKTENRLVLFQDGTYLELIAFIEDDPKHREGHWWDKPYGVVDYALTTADSDFGELSGIIDRLGKTDTGISYDAPKDGGRIKPDGQELKWRVTFPEGTSRGSVPFFCHDVTPRNRRVPAPEHSHPSGVVGMAGVLVEVASDASLARLSNATAALLDQEAAKNETRYEVDVVHRVPNAKNPTIRIQKRGDGSHGEHNDLALSLVLQGPKAIDAVHRKIDGGTVSLVFEQQ